MKAAGAILVTGAVLTVLLTIADKRREARSIQDLHHEHEAHHGGCLNVIEMCSVGHAEVTLENATLCLWFVGGENDTGRAVPVSDEKITLTIKTESGEKKELVLLANPIALAEERPGHCSRFEATADWLKGIQTFQASGTVNFKGKSREFEIHYPEGYDSDDSDHHSSAAVDPAHDAPKAAERH
jgi:hypothetical protein